MEELGEYLQGVLEHSFKYMFMSKGTLVDMLDRAKITQAEGIVDISAGDLFVKGDELFVSVDTASNLAKQMTFKTTLGEDTIIGTVKLATIENGVNRPTHMEIEVPTQAIKITSETYDWILQK